MKLPLYIKIIKTDIFSIKVFIILLEIEKKNKEKLIFILCVISIILRPISFRKYIASLYECGKVFLKLT